MIKVKHPETREELEFKSKIEILRYFQLKCTYVTFIRKSNKVGAQKALDHFYSRLIRVKHPETGEELVFKSQNDLFEYFNFKYSIASLNIKIKEVGVQEAINYYYFKNKKIKVTHPETGEELEFASQREIVDYFDLELSYNTFNIRSSKFGIQEALNYYYSKDKYFIKHPETGEELEFKNISEMWLYFKPDCSYGTFYKRFKESGIDEAIKPNKKNKIIKFRVLEFKTYKDLREYFGLSYFNSAVINRYNHLTIEEIVIMLKLKKGYIFVENSYDDFYFQEISEFAKEKGLSEEYVKQKLNEGFKAKIF